MTIAVETTNEQLGIKTKVKVLFVEGVGKAFHPSSSRPIVLVRKTTRFIKKGIGVKRDKTTPIVSSQFLLVPFFSFWGAF